MPDASANQRARHWDNAYATRGVEGVAWYQPVPSVSLELIDALGVRSAAAVLDVGGGASFLADALFERGFSDVTVLDLSQSALEAVRRRLPTNAPVELIRADLLSWQPDRSYDLWHDRAVLHFLVGEADRRRYLDVMRDALAPDGFVIVATFAEDGPGVCSGLPVRRYSSEDLVTELGDTFQLVETRREMHVTPRGAFQPFTWVAGRCTLTEG